MAALVPSFSYNIEAISAGSDQEYLWIAAGFAIALVIMSLMYLLYHTIERRRIEQDRSTKRQSIEDLIAMKELQ
jgi:hypothetical protein